MEIIRKNGKEYLVVEKGMAAEIDRWEGETPILKAQSIETTDPATGAKSVNIIVPSLRIESGTSRGTNNG